MYNIDEYINKAENMKNISDGGSSAYSFGEFVLVRYSMSKKYGVSRPNEESVAKYANEKSEKGVRTPKHVAIKRVIDGEQDICWVLQEAAKGRSFTYYCDNAPEIQIERQKELVNAPDAHYQQLIHDLSELINLGVEIKSKNIFYDNNRETGGFTIIDLLGGNNESFNFNSIKDVLVIWTDLYNLFYDTKIDDFKTVSQVQRQETEKLNLMISKKLFNALEKVIPNFVQHRRWILRTLNPKTLEFFSKNGIAVGDLTLNKEEEIIFNERASKIVTDIILKIQNGESTYSQVERYIISNSLNSIGMNDAWLYHNSNNKKSTDYSSMYEYRSACSRELSNIILEIFDKKLEEISQNTTNENIINAKKDMDKRREDKER